MSKSLSQIALLPEGVGLGVGLVDGIIADKTTSPHLRTYWRAAVGAAGFIGDRWGNWQPDIAIGMMTAAATLAAQSIPYAIHNKAFGGENGVFPLARPVGTHPHPQNVMPTPSAKTTDSGRRRQRSTIAG